MKFKSMIAAVLVVIGFSASVSAHTLWVNLFESRAHIPAHVLACVGWGHNTPMDDMPSNLGLESYTLYTPDMTPVALPLPATEPSETLDLKGDLKVLVGEVGARKIVLGKDVAPGVYQVSLVSQDNFYTKYIDKKGRSRWATKSMDEIEDAEKIVRGMLYRGYAVSYFSQEKWETPKSLNYDLEIVPETDLTDVHVGDLVKFKVLFMGKPLNTSPDVSLEYITAVSDTFGGPDKFTLSSMVFEGKGQFRMPSAGHWLVNVYTRQQVGPDTPLAHLDKKCTTALYSSSLSFKVKP